MQHFYYKRKILCTPFTTEGIIWLLYAYKITVHPVNQIPFWFQGEREVQISFTILRSQYNPKKLFLCYSNLLQTLFLRLLCQLMKQILIELKLVLCGAMFHVQYPFIYNFVYLILEEMNSWIHLMLSFRAKSDILLIILI